MPTQCEGESDKTTAGIPANIFYKSNKNTFIPPALAPGTPRRAALRAIRHDTRHDWNTFRTQRDAFTHVDARPGRGLHVWAFEVAAGGRRRFVTASYAAFWRQYARMLRGQGAAHFYEVIRECRAAKLYLDLEFVPRCNVDADGDGMTCAVVLECLRAAGKNGRCDADTESGDGIWNNIMILDSTTEKKFSRHVVFEKIAFHDNVQMGAFVEEVVNTIRKQDERLVMVQKEDGVEVPFVDLGVYTRNRCFRLVGSSKFGKTIRLSLLPWPRKEGDAIERKDGEDSKPRVSREEFIRSLVCSVRPEMKLLGQPTVQPKLANGVSIGTKRARSSDGCSTNDTSSTMQNGQVYGNLTYGALDAYVQSLIGPHGGAVHGVTVWAGSESVVYTLKGGYRYCGNIGRHHKSNNVMLIADLKLRGMFQRCFDPDCRGYRSPLWRLPDNVFAVVDSEGGMAVEGEDDVEDEALNRMMDEVEGVDAGGDDGIDDAAMVKAMEEALRSRYAGGIA